MEPLPVQQATDLEQLQGELGLRRQLRRRWRAVVDVDADLEPPVARSRSRAGTSARVSSLLT